MRARVTAVVTLLVVVGIAIASVLAYAATASQLRHQTDSFLTTRANELASGFRGPPQAPGGPFQGPGGGLERPGRPAFEPDTSVQFLDRNGQVVAGNGEALPVDDIDRAVAAGERQRLIRPITMDGVDYRMITVPSPDGAVQVASDVAASGQVLTRLALELTLVGIGLALVSALVGWVLMRRSMAPLERLTVASERVAETSSTSSPTMVNNLTVVDRADAERGDEIGRLARSIDRMLAALAMSREQQRRLVQDAAHELRTPLTSLRANVEFLSYADRLDEADRHAILDALQQETDELTMLFDELVQLAVDPAASDAHPVRSDLIALTESVVDRFRRRTGRTVEVVVADPAGVPVGTVVVSLVERALANLLGNAHKFAPSDTPITVELRATQSPLQPVQQPSQQPVHIGSNDHPMTNGTADSSLERTTDVSGPTLVWWHVRDEGPGIDAADRALIFDRFYRSEQSRSSPGSGLGLAIVRQVAEQHGGSVSVGEAPNGGADVAFSVAVTPT